MPARLAALPRRLLSLADLLLAAGRGGGAAAGGRTPAAPDLLRLGIDPDRYALIRRG